LQAAKAALDSSKATLSVTRRRRGPDVPFLKLNMERAEQMFKDGVMSKSLVEDAEKNYHAGAEQAGQRAAQPCRLEGRNPKSEAQVAQARLRSKTLKRIGAIHNRQSNMTDWSSHAT